VTDVILGLQDLPPGDVVWIPGGSESPHPRPLKSHDLHSLITPEGGEFLDEFKSTETHLWELHPSI
jgi:hypothetical protein